MDLIKIIRNFFCRDCLEENMALKRGIGELSAVIELLKTEEKEAVPRAPNWLDQNVQAYEPKIQAVQQNDYIETIELEPQDIYAVSSSLKEIVKDHGWKDMEHDHKLRAIWKFVIDAIRYRFDKGDSWHFPITTIYRMWGDCEDGVILFVTLCKLAGVSEDEVFNACGWFDDGKTRFGHSWPVAQMEDGKWRIFETTIDSYPPGGPKLFKGSSYRAEWGLANWKFQGGIRHGAQENWQV